MREYQFRIWDKVLLHMYYPNDNDTEPNLWDLKGCVEGGKLVGKNCKIMQYTGIKDKNGKEIYEGDIFGNIIELRCVVKRQEDGAYKLVFLNAQIAPISILDRMVSNSVIMGNIYENPELLESEVNNE